MHICQLCLEHGNDVHHIDYDKNNNQESNLITLCHKCNLKINKNRVYWSNYFQEATGNRAIIQKRPAQLMRVVLQKKT